MQLVISQEIQDAEQQHFSDVQLDRLSSPSVGRKEAPLTRTGRSVDSGVGLKVIRAAQEEEDQGAGRVLLPYLESGFSVSRVG